MISKYFNKHSRNSLALKIGGIAILLLLVISAIIFQSVSYKTPVEESNELSTNNKDLTPHDDFAPVGHPLAEKKEPSSLYGWRIDPFSFHSKRHQGIDFSAPAGTPVLATGNGKVIASSYDPANGQFIEIEHASNDGKTYYRTKFLHLKSSYVRMGDLVKPGQTIGEVGSTGRSTSPHLHYEITYLNQHINPLNIIGKDNLAVASNELGAAKVNATNPNLQRVLFIRNSGVEYRMVDLSKPQQF